VGFPPDWDLNSANSLGIELVNVLVQQLQGTIELERSTGSKFQISFSESLD
jgi:two-component sensor histidine kinase